MKFSDKLSYLRVKNGMTMEELGKAANVSKASIFFYEQGRKPHKNTIIQLAKALHVDFDLLNDDERSITNE